MAVTVDFQPCYVGATSPSWDIPITAGGQPENLAGVDVTKFTLYFKLNSGSETPGTGTFTLKTPYPGEVFYKPSVTDVAAIFGGSIVIKAFYPPSFTNADEMVFDPIAFSIVAS